MPSLPCSPPYSCALCGPQALVNLLTPLQPTAVVENAAAALGSLAGHAGGRLALRSLGGVGALVRLLKADCPARMQVRARARLHEDYPAAALRRSSAPAAKDAAAHCTTWRRGPAGNRCFPPLPPLL
jgi:hypothetical protein